MTKARTNILRKYVGIQCRVLGCENPASYPHEIGPVCNAHYLRSRRYGSFKLPERKHISRDPIYRVWTNIKSRCNNPKATGHHLYGGRGIRICPEWELSFERFLSDVGPRPTADHSLDRIDVNGDYAPGNCRWATQREQCRNTRTNHTVMVDGEEITLAEAVQDSPLLYNTVLYRLKRGWRLNDALTLPPQKGVRP